MNYKKYIAENTLRVEASYRGGGIEIDCSKITGEDGDAMTAYQNYLGGGMLGSIQSDKNFTSDKKEIAELQEELKMYFHELTNPGHDEWSASDYDANQMRPASAY